jgi:hypothetical protein
VGLIAGDVDHDGAGGAAAVQRAEVGLVMVGIAVGHGGGAGQGDGAEGQGGNGHQTHLLVHERILQNAGCNAPVVERIQGIRSDRHHGLDSFRKT